MDDNELPITTSNDTDIEGLPSLDLGAEENECRDIEANAEAFLIFGSEMIPLRVDQRGRDGMTGSVVGTLLMEETEDLHFTADEVRPGGVLVVSPIRFVHENGVTRLWLKYVSASADSEVALLHLMVQRLWLPDLCTESIQRKEHGWHFDFATAERKDPTLKDRVDQLNRQSNRQNRATIRQTIGWYDSEDHNSGLAYRVSTQAVTIMADERLPAEGAEVTVNFPLNCGQAVVTGTVAWVMPAGTGDHAGAFTLNIEHVEDGDNGRLWGIYIEELLTTTNRPF